MKECHVLLEIKHSIEKIPGVYYCKIPDQARFKEEKSRFAPPRPFDCFGLYAGIPFAFEAKYHGGLGAFPFARVSDNQLSELSKFKMSARYGKRPVISGLLLCLWQDRTDRRRLYFFDIDQWVDLSHYIRAKSIRPGAIELEGRHIAWLGNGFWDFKSFFNFFKKNP